MRLIMPSWITGGMSKSSNIMINASKAQQGTSLIQTSMGRVSSLNLRSSMKSPRLTRSKFAEKICLSKELQMDNTTSTGLTTKMNGSRCSRPKRRLVKESHPFMEWIYTCFKISWTRETMKTSGHSMESKISICRNFLSRWQPRKVWISNARFAA